MAGPWPFAGSLRTFRARRGLAPGRKGRPGGRGNPVGDVNPSGRLSVTVPRHVGQLPVYYNYKKWKHYWMKQGWGRIMWTWSRHPYPFGFGLSYAQVAYSDLHWAHRPLPRRRESRCNCR